MYKSLKIEQGDLSHKSQKCNNHEGGKSPIQHVFTFHSALTGMAWKEPSSAGSRRYDTTWLFKTLLNEPIIPAIVMETVNQRLLRPLEHTARTM